MNYTIELDKELKIIKYTVRGPVVKDDIGVGWEKVFNSKEFTDLGYNVLADYRKAQFSFSIADTTILDKIINTSKDAFYGKKNAVVVNLPHNTAISMLVKDKFHADLNYDIKIFYTEEAAMKWLLE